MEYLQAIAQPTIPISVSIYTRPIHFTRLEPDVLSIVDFQSSMDRIGRSYEAYFEVMTQEQEIVRIAFVGSQDYYYPSPDDAASPASLCGDDGWVSWSNKLYYLVNFQLPRPGDSTWYNTWARTN